MPVVLKATYSDDEELRQKATSALARIHPDPQAAVREMIRLLADSSPEVRSSAAYGLVYLGPVAEPAIPQLTAGLTDPSAGVRIASAQALGNIGPAAKAALPGLAQMALHESGFAQMDAVTALPRVDLEGTVAVPTLLSLLATDRSGPWAPGFNAWRRKHPHADARLYYHQADRAKVRELAARALGPFAQGRPAVLRALRLALDDASPHVRIAAAGSLIRAGERDAGLAELGKYTSSRNPEVRIGVGVAFVEAGLPDRGIALLIECLRAGHEDYRADAARALGVLGPRARDAIPSLVDAAERDPHSHVRRTAAEALRKIDPTRNAGATSGG